MVARIFFEKIRWIHYPLIRHYLRRGFEVHVFDFDCNMKRSFLFRRLINKKKIHRVYVSPLIKGHGEGIAQTEIIYHRLKNRILEKIIARLYLSDEVDMVFKKWLSHSVVQCLYIHEYLKEEEKKRCGCPIFFVPDSYPVYFNLLLNYGTLSLSNLKNVKIPGWAPIFSVLTRGWEKMEYLVGSVFYFSSRKK